MGQGQTSVGAQLEERYFLQKVKLGQGSFGTVWRAVDKHKGITVAIKQLDKATLPRRGVTRQDIEREISMMKACSHENITKLFDTFEDNSSIYLALEYCDGGDFGDKVRERGLVAEEKEVAEWMRQMCAAICALHAKSICHRDIKPDNFMVSEATPQASFMLKLSDFGLAIYLPKGKLLQEKCGTPAFMAPEQHHLPKRSSGYSFPVDVWAAGVSMYMVIFGGKHPFLNERGHLDDNMLLTGEMDFRDPSANKGFFGLGNFGGVPMRFSEDARALCKKMVEPDQAKRISAEDTRGLAWLGTGAKGAVAGRSPSPPTPTDGQGAASEPRGTPRSSPERRPRPQEALSKEAAGGLRPKETGSQRPPAGTEAPRGVVAANFAPFPQPSGPGLRPHDEREAAKLRDAEAERAHREAQLEGEKRQLKDALHRQKTKESEMLEKQVELEKQLVQMQQQMEEADRLKKTAAPPPAKTVVRGAPPALSDDAAVLRRASSGKLGSLLSRGMKCRYESGTYGWMNAVVQGYNESDGTYNLDVRQHAALDKISPTGTSLSEAWPPGTLATYHSASVNYWLPAVVVSFNESDTTYNLDVRDHADVDRIRARIHDRSGDESTPSRALSRKHTSELSTQLGADAGRRGAASSSSPARQEGRGRATRDLETSLVDRPSAGSTDRKVRAGDHCVVSEHGLVVIEGVRDTLYTLRIGPRGRQTVPIEAVRAPAEPRYAWPASTKVSYQSSSLNGKWIDAIVVSFEASNSTYNLDVRYGAAADKVRPR